MTVFEIGTASVGVPAFVAWIWINFIKPRLAAKLPEIGKTTDAEAVKPDSSIFIFTPDAAHKAYLDKMASAMTKFPPEFQLAQIYAGKSPAEALEAWAQKEDAK